MRLFKANKSIDLLQSRKRVILETVDNTRKRILERKENKNSSPERKESLDTSLNEQLKDESKTKPDISLNCYTEDDLVEATRADRYALFDELKQKETITLFDIKESLCRLGITDPLMQNKFLYFILQTRQGLQFSFSPLVYNILLDEEQQLKKVQLFVNQDEYQTNIEFKDGKIRLILESILRDSMGQEALKSHIVIDIASDKTVISQFTVTQIGDGSEAKAAFDILRKDRIGLLERLLNFFKRLFLGVAPGIELENDATHVFEINESQFNKDFKASLNDWDNPGSTAHRAHLSSP